MFCTLQLTKEVEDSDLETIRLKYWVLDEESLHNINEIESEAVQVEVSDPLEQSDVDIEIDIESDDDVPINGSIGLEMFHDCGDDVELTSTVNNDVSYLVEFECENDLDYNSEGNSHSLPSQSLSFSNGHNRIGFLGDTLSESDSDDNGGKDSHSSPLNIPKRLQSNPSSSKKAKKIKGNYALCEKCGRKFQYPIWWNRHIRIHDKEKRFAIDRCSKYLDEAPPTSAAEAAATAQEHEDEHNRFICKVCPKGFKYRCWLKRHMIIHTKEKLFVCKHCDSRFSRRDNLLRHFKTACLRKNTS